MEDINRNQFVYKREVEVPPVAEDKENGIEAAEGYTKTVLDSFNIESVTRTITMDDGRLMLLLDDLHERNQDVPKINKITRQPILTKKGTPQIITVRDTFQSEIYLSAEEAKEYFKLTAINNYE